MPLSQTEREKAFILRARKKYGSSYDYSLANYIDQRTHLVIICQKHGKFHTSPKNFLSSTKTIGCPHCRREERLSNHVKVVAESKETKKCETDNFNVRGGTKKYDNLLRQVFV